MKANYVRCVYDHTKTLHQLVKLFSILLPHLLPCLEKITWCSGSVGITHVTTEFP